MKVRLMLTAALAALVALPTGVCAQNDGTQRAIRPVDVPMSFAGTYGELRHNHFHQGVDWRVGGKVGDPIHAIKDGWVSRVSVSNTGYGNAVYIDHYDGTTSVYGHMLCFRDDIAARVKMEQYKAQSFSVDLQFKKSDFPLKQGDVFGKVGNTGSSAGPHLHMEVRDTEQELPLNYISMGYYTPADNLSPVFRRIAFYGLDTLPIPNSYKIAMISNPLMYKQTVNLPRVSYVAVDAYDTQNGTTGKLAVEDYKVLLDGKPLFHYKVGNVGFTEGRYIQSLVQPGESGADLVKTWMDPGNILDSRAEVENGGLIVLDDNHEHSLRFEATDEHGNRSVVRLTVRRDDGVVPPPSQPDSTATSLEWLWYMPNVIDNEDFTYALEPGSLYNNANVSYKRVAARDSAAGILSNVWQISSASPLHKGGRIAFSAPVPEGLEGKTFIAQYYKGNLSYAGGRVGFGTYCLAYDVTPPVVSTDRYGRLRVSDARSGVASVSLEIDGKWHLFKYYRGIVTILDKESISKGTHKIKVTAIDNCGNSIEYEKSQKF